MAALGTLAFTNYYLSTQNFYFKVEAPQSPTPLSTLGQSPTVPQIKLAVNFLINNWHLDRAEFYGTIKCESGFKYNAFAPNKYGGSYGIAQFIPQTFSRMCRGDYTSARDQLICAAKMFQMGLQKNWDCYNNLFGGG